MQIVHVMFLLFIEVTRLVSIFESNMSPDESGRSSCFWLHRTWFCAM